MLPVIGVLKPCAMVNTKIYQPNVNRFEFFAIEMASVISKKAIQGHFFTWHTTVHSCSKTSLWHVGCTQLGSVRPCYLFNKLGFVQVLVTCIVGTSTCWATFHYLRECPKKVWWLSRLGKVIDFVAQRPQTVGQWEECISRYGLEYKNSGFVFTYLTIIYMCACVACFMCVRSKVAWRQRTRNVNDQTLFAFPSP